MPHNTHLFWLAVAIVAALALLLLARLVLVKWWPLSARQRAKAEAGMSRADLKDPAVPPPPPKPDGWNGGQ